MIANGIAVNGTHYKLILVNNTICGQSEGAGRIAIRATHTSIVVAHCPEGCQFEWVIRGVNATALFVNAHTPVDDPEV